MAKIIQLLQKIEIPFNPSSVFPERKPVFSFPTKIAGGISINVIPDKCEAYGDVRLLPDNTPQQVKEIIGGKLDKTGVDYQIQDILSVPAVKISPTEEIVELLSKHSKDILGKQPILQGAGPWNDGWMFISKGIPAVCGFGPDGEGIHSKNECVYLESVRKITEIYLRTIINFLEIEK